MRNNVNVIFVLFHSCSFKLGINVFYSRTCNKIIFAGKNVFFLCGKTTVNQSLEKKNLVPQKNANCLNRTCVRVSHCRGEKDC
jgi:hypothetical protein